MREDWSRDFTRATSEADYVTPPPGMGELTEVQAEAILNMRLRSLRRLEEMELLRERDALMEERAGSRICWPMMACNGTASPRAARGAQDLRQNPKAARGAPNSPRRARSRRCRSRR
jgi:hypothetical protein